MKCQILFIGKIRKKIINLSSAENAQRVVKVNLNNSIPGSYALIDTSHRHTRCKGRNF